MMPVDPHDGLRARGVPSRALLHGALGNEWLLAVALLAGCSSSESPGDRPSQASGNHPPVVRSVDILPAPLVLTGPLTVRVEAQDLDQQNISFRYRWRVNGELVAGHTHAEFPADKLKRGNIVQVEVTPFDGIVEGAPLQSAASTVVNTPPIVSSLAVEYDLEIQGRQVLAKADVLDPDHDQVTLTYRWMQNGKVLQEGESDRIEAVGLTAKVPLQVEVTATDGASNGATTVTQQFQMSNSLPTIVSQPPTATKDGAYTYIVQATDADGDTLAYRLETGPPGMAIDSKTGHITWTPSPEAKGTFSVRIVATDSQGGFASQEFQIAMTQPAGSS